MRGWLLVLAAGCGRFGFDPLAGGSPDGTTGPRTLEIVVSGKGIVQGPGILCRDHCFYTIDGEVPVTAFPAETWQLANLGACGATASCTVSAVETQLAVEFTQPPITANRAFVTSTMTSFTAGRAALDTACATAATNSGLTGTFIALVSTSTQDARARLAGSQGWVRLDGLPILDQPTDMGRSDLPRGVTFDEVRDLAVSSVPTGSTEQGVADQTCGDWSVTAGSASFACPLMGARFGYGGALGACQSPGHVLCFEVGKSVALALAPPAFPIGRHVFVGGTFLPGGGITAADAQCASQAVAAGLAGTYVALLATSTQSAADHLGSTAGPWRRADGALITLGSLDDVLDTEIAVSITDHTAWSGFGGALDQIPTVPATTCNDWTQPNTDSGFQIFTNSMAPFGTLYTLGSCMNPSPLLCAER